MPNLLTRINLWFRLIRLCPVFYRAAMQTIARPHSTAAQHDFDRVISLVEATHRDLGRGYQAHLVLPEHRN